MVLLILATLLMCFEYLHWPGLRSKTPVAAPNGEYGPSPFLAPYAVAAAVADDGASAFDHFPTPDPPL